MLVCGIEFATVSEYVDQKRPKNNMKYDFRNKERKKDATKMFYILYHIFEFTIGGNGAGLAG